MFLFTWQTLFRVSDVGINVLLSFIATFLTLLVSVFGLRPLQEFVQHLPRTVRIARRYLGGNFDNFIKFVSCPKCHCVYPLEDCKVVLPNRMVVSGRCSYIKFPNHPQPARRPCNTLLMKTVRTSSGTTSLYPQQMYCFRSIIESLKEMIKRPGFIENVKHGDQEKLQMMYLKIFMTEMYGKNFWILVVYPFYQCLIILH